MDTIDARIEEIARQVFDDDDLVLTDTMVAADVPAWDSLAHVNFIYGIEEAFDVHFSEDEFVGFDDVGDLKRIVRQKVESR